MNSIIYFCLPKYNRKMSEMPNGSVNDNWHKFNSDRRYPWGYIVHKCCDSIITAEGIALLGVCNG